MANAIVFQTGIADPFARFDNDTWLCNLCQRSFDNVIKIIMHVLLHCPKHAGAGPRANATTSTIVKICAYLDHFMEVFDVLNKMIRGREVRSLGEL